MSLLFPVDRQPSRCGGATVTYTIVDCLHKCQTFLLRFNENISVSLYFLVET